MIKKKKKQNKIHSSGGFTWSRHVHLQTASEALDLRLETSILQYLSAR